MNIVISENLNKKKFRFFLLHGVFKICAAILIYILRKKLKKEGGGVFAFKACIDTVNNEKHPFF